MKTLKEDINIIIELYGKGMIHFGMEVDRHPPKNPAENIYCRVQRAMMKKDIEIAKLQGELWAFTKEVRRLHPSDCTCITCKDK